MNILTDFISNIILTHQMKKLHSQPVFKSVQKRSSYVPVESFVHEGKPLKLILEEHDEWIESQGEKGTQAVLVNANLRCADLKGVNLFGADLQKADLCGANLYGASLWGANLKDAVLWRSNLVKALLVGANLQKANLSNSNIKKAFLWEANLKEANLKEANIKKADLTYANINKSRELGSVLFSKGTILKATKADSETWEDNIPLRKQWEWQNFLHTFRYNHRILFWTWKIICNCGESLTQWFLWSLVFLFLYGFIYSLNPQWIDMGEYRTFLSPYYFSVITFATLGYGDVIPACLQGQIMAITEVFAGYVMLGGLITIFAKKIVV